MISNEGCLMAGRYFRSGAGRDPLWVLIWRARVMNVGVDECVRRYERKLLRCLLQNNVCYTR